MGHIHGGGGWGGGGVMSFSQASHPTAFETRLEFFPGVSHRSVLLNSQDGKMEMVMG